MEAGADVAVLCDTNGGMLPHRLADVVADGRRPPALRVGIHAHDDTRLRGGQLARGGATPVRRTCRAR